MTTLQIHFHEGPVVRLAVSSQALLSMLELRPGMDGVAFRKNLKFAVVQDGIGRQMMSSSHIHLLNDES